MAQLYLDSTDTVYSVSGSNTNIYGANGSQTVVLSTGVTNEFIDGNVEGLQLSGSSSSYKFMQTGNLLNIYDMNGLLVAKDALASSSSAGGTQLTFSDGTMLAKLAPKFDSSGMIIGANMQIANAIISDSIPAAIGITIPTSINTTLLNSELLSAGYISPLNNLQISSALPVTFGSIMGAKGWSNNNSLPSYSSVKNVLSGIDANSLNWISVAGSNTTDANSSPDNTISFQGIAGNTYTVADVAIGTMTPISIYSNTGATLATSQGEFSSNKLSNYFNVGNSAGGFILKDFVAPYTGTYYASANGIDMGILIFESAISLTGVHQ